MPGRLPRPGRRSARHRLRAVLVAAAAATAAGLPLLCFTPTSAAATQTDGIHLATPVEGVDPLTNVNLGLRHDRLLKSVVPGRVRNEEQVRVEVGPSGAPARVTDRQRLVIDGAGNYIVRELGPAREAVGLGGTVPPVLELGTVVWQGFSPGRRELSALLTLDAGIEAARLPLKVGLVFRDSSGRATPLRAGAVAPSNGTVTVTLTNNTSSTRTLEVGTAAAAPLARLLDRLRAVAAHPKAAVPPVAGAGLPRIVAGHAIGRTSFDVVAPLRVTGTVTTPGGARAVSGPGLTPTPTGARVAGTLSGGSASFSVQVTSGDRLGLDLDVRPWLDPRSLVPPPPYSSWQRWLAAGGTHADAATDILVTAAAAAARAAEYSPYLQADAPGSDLSTFTYVVADATARATAKDDAQPRPGAITAAAVALLAVVGNAALLRRQL